MAEQKPKPTPRKKAIDVKTDSDEIKLEVGVKEIIIIGLFGTGLVIGTIAGIHALKERSKRKTIKSIANTVGSVFKQIAPLALPDNAGRGAAAALGMGGVKKSASNSKKKGKK